MVLVYSEIVTELSERVRVISCADLEVSEAPCWVTKPGMAWCGEHACCVCKRCCCVFARAVWSFSGRGRTRRVTRAALGRELGGSGRGGEDPHVLLFLDYLNTLKACVNILFLSSSGNVYINLKQNPQSLHSV